MPTILMFGGYTTNSYHYDATMQTDENKGLVITNGMTLSATGELFENWNGSVNKRLNVVGPNKVHYNLGNNPEGWFRKNIGYDSECSMVYQAENPDKAFRLAIGLTNKTTNSFSITVYLFDRATDMLIHSETKEFTGISLGNDYYSGNIVIYGQYGKETVVDQAYIVNAMDLNGILTQVNEKYSGVCAFRENAVDSCVVGENVSVSDMIEDVNNYTLTLVKNGEVYMQITDNSFTVQDAGEYELYYWDQSNNKPIKMQFTVRQNV